jgi:phosphate transport system permease protein
VTDTPTLERLMEPPEPGAEPPAVDASAADGPPPRRHSAPVAGADKVFRVVATSSGVVLLAITGAIGIFLAFRAAEALHRSGLSFLTTASWNPDGNRFGIKAILLGTTLIAGTALLFAIPLSIGSALYLSEYAPRRVRRLLISLVDLMAAVPSVIYGLWGFFFLQNHVLGLSRFLSTYLGWFPLFHVDGSDPSNPLVDNSLYRSSSFIAGMVVALMVTPIATSVIREVFSQAPLGEREGAYALGATRWGMIRSVVLPFGRGGIVGGVMLGLGRALGETIAVVLIISPIYAVQPHVLEKSTSSISSLIALKFGEASPFATSALMAAGLVLFLITLVVNFGAASVVARSRSGAGSDG